MLGCNLKLAFFASGTGSAVRSVYRQLIETPLPIEISLIVTNNNNCGCAKWARQKGIPVVVFDRAFAAEKTDHDCRQVLDDMRIDLIVLGGFLRRVGPHVLAAYSGRIVNLHPALLPKYGGPGMYGRYVHEAVLAAGEIRTGATLHLVDAAYDEGAIILQRMVQIETDENAVDLGARVIDAEGQLLFYFLRHYALGNAH